MSYSNYSKVGLYKHNIESYEKIKHAFESGENIVGIVHATGTGKSYNALQLAYDNKAKKTLYIVPNNSIIEHIQQTIKDNPNLDLENDFKNLEFRTYQSLINMSDEELEKLDYDYLIIDEFHHIGAPIWGKKIKKIIDSHPNMKVLGMTAYTVRDRGTQFERDMANPETNEIFSNKIVSRYDLCDAMIDGVLPKPMYRSAYIRLIEFVDSIETKLDNSNLPSNEYYMYKNIIHDIKKRISEAPSIEDVVRKNIKKDGKYIYFCPTWSEDGVNDIDTIMKQAKEWFKKYIPEADIVFYKTTSEDGKIGKINRDAFYYDKALSGESADGKLRIMFAINQYNEGVHAPNIDGVIMGRGTTSDIIFFEQLGRALSVRGNTKEKIEEYKKYTRDQLVIISGLKGILILDDESKEDIIEKLVEPMIIDLTGNFDFIKELENNLKDKVKEIQNTEKGNKIDIKIGNAKFDIEIENKDLFEVLKYLKDRLAPRTWDEWYDLACKYYEYHGNLDVPYNFKTVNGYEYNQQGIGLGNWIMVQRSQYNNNKLSREKIDRLKLIDFDFSKYKSRTFTWDDSYLLAKTYYEYYGNLNVPINFKTTNGYEYDKNGYNLYNWLLNQRSQYRHLRGMIYAYKRQETENSFFDEKDKQIKLSKINKLKNAMDKLILIGFIGDSKINEELNKEVCSKHGLNYDKYKEILSKISYYDLVFKISFLEEHNIPLIENEKLNNIFFMSVNQLKECYGNSYQDFIDKYHNVVNKKTRI